MRIQQWKTDEERPKQRPFILVTNKSFNNFFTQQKKNQTFFCHYINDESTSACEVCVEFEPLDEEQNIHELRQASHLYDQDAAFNDPVEKEISQEFFSSFIRDESYQRFIEVFEKNIYGDFLNVESTINVDVSKQYPRTAIAQTRVIGRGQFSVVFAIENALPGLALRRFPGFHDRQDAHNFLLTHEAALTIYHELGVKLEPTRLILVEARDGYTIYMIQRHLKQEELAENFIEGLLDHGPMELALTIKSQGSNGEHYDMTYAESVSRILNAVITAIYTNLVKLGNQTSALSLCCDAKPDNFGIGFEYKKEWLYNNLYMRGVVTQADLTDFHPCTLILFDQVLFDGGPEAKMLKTLLGYNPYGVFKKKIETLSNAKKINSKNSIEYCRSCR